MAHLYRVILPVSPIEAGASFYAAVLEQPGARVSPGRHYFDCEGTILACFDPEADHERRDPKPNPEHIYFAVDDLDAALERCRAAGAEITEEIASYPWGETAFYANDPFGNQIRFVDRTTVFTGPRAEARRR